MSAATASVVITENAITLFSPSIYIISTWLVPTLLNLLRLFHRTVDRTHETWHPEIPINKKQYVVTKAFFIGLFLSLIILIVSATTVGLLSNKIDDRTSYIIAGVSYLVSSIFIFLISYDTPKWLGVYNSVKDERRTHIGKSLKSLGFHVRFAVYSEFAKIYFFLLPFFCGTKPGTIPNSVGSGLLTGLLLVGGIDVANRRITKEKKKIVVSIFIAFGIMLISTHVHVAGVVYIAQVWTSYKNIFLLASFSFWLWFLASIILHLTAFLYTEAKKECRGSSVIARKTTFLGKSMYFSKKSLIGKDCPENENEKQEEGEDEQFQQAGGLGKKDDEETTVTETDGGEKIIIDNSNTEEETYFELLKLQLGFCRCCSNKEGNDNGKEGKELSSCQEKVLTVLGWVSRVLFALSSTFFVVVVCGAQAQEIRVRAYLPLVYEYVYKDLNTGPVCAYDDNYGGNDTSTERKVTETQRNFTTPALAHEAGYEILHCGECGACSNWNDLRIEYTTRNSLGQTALQCAQRSLLGGGFEALKQCTMEQTGFHDACATCWTQDYMCTRQHCLFIALKGFMINSVTNLQVGPEDITPATCEEAFCEATEITGYVGFVPCSGATRRRMNLISTIARSESEQCQHVDVLPWEDFFGYSRGYGDIDPAPGSVEISTNNINNTLNRMFL